ncbi:MAG TPA: carboxypeptidase-like regulatory domain-containing protein, partial [Thermoanaerobaculia bacterium]
AGDPGPDCDLTAGTPVAVAVGATASGIDFALDPGGAIAGTVTETGTGAPVADAGIWIWDGGGALVKSGTADAFGHYTLRALPAGSYFVTAAGASGVNVHFGELYDDMHCPGGESPECDATTGTPVAVAFNTTTPGVDFVLDHFGSIVGTVTDLLGEPISGVEIEVWDAGGAMVGFDFGAQDGSFRIDGLSTGTYYVVAHTFGAYVDELYDDLPCPTGDCGDPTKGSPVAVTVNAATQVDFSLGTFDQISTIFSDGFESGDLTAWTSAVGGQ